VTLATLYFFAHQPFRLRPWQHREALVHVAPENLERFFFDEELNESIFRKVAQSCYLPATRLVLRAVEKHANAEKPFKISFGLSGTFLEQAARWEPEIIELFRALVRTGLVELCGETYYHGLSSLFDGAEFRAQTRKHAELLFDLFGVRPRVFRNTEMLYNDGICAAAAEMGFEGVITEGVDWLMANWRSPDFVYSGAHLPVLLRNYRLSDDVGYRFSNKSWEGHPLRAETFAGWLAKNTDPCVLIAMDYEALGEHMSADTGIFDFLEALPNEVAKHAQLEWSTPSETIRRVPPIGEIRVGDFETISWADRERDTSAWLGSAMQQMCFDRMRRMRHAIVAAKNSYLADVWRKMQTSDHLYYLADKALSDGDVHKYFSAYGAVPDAFVRLYTALYDLEQRAERFVEPEHKAFAD